MKLRPKGLGLRRHDRDGGGYGTGSQIAESLNRLLGTGNDDGGTGNGAGMTSGGTSVGGSGSPAPLYGAPAAGFSGVPLYGAAPAD